MNRRERLMATLRGESVDRVPVCFYEINGLDEDPLDPSPLNVYSDPSWKPVLDLAREKTDRIVMRSIPFGPAESDETPHGGPWTALDVVPDFLPGRRKKENWVDDKGSWFERVTLSGNGRDLTCLTRRDPDMNTIWTVEPLLKSAEDLAALLDFPPAAPKPVPDISGVLEAESRLDDSGIVMIDTFDPLCVPLLLLHMDQFVLTAVLHKELFHRFLEFCSNHLASRVEAISRALPGRLWRIYGPEAATPPMLSPTLFSEFVVRYDRPLIEIVQQHGGYARVHAHGRMKDVLDQIAATGCDGLDPIEPPPQGDVTLSHVRRSYGQQMVLFGNLEIVDIEALPPKEFRKKIATALDEGTAGPGRGFVLMPSASPYGRTISARTVRNYELMVEMVEKG
ncbi:MAG: hypothetical protein JW888_18765 [Pirellulales bacterium]|nr:hypothetical protein [Pirellulales bacterium]